MAGDGHSRAPSRLLVSPFVFAICWWLIVALHVLNGLLVLVIALIYLYFSRSAVYVNTSILQIPQFMLQLSGWSYLAVAGLHGYALSRILLRSVRHGELTFKRVSPIDAVQRKALTTTESTLVANRQLVMFGALQRGSKVIRRAWARWFGIDGLLGVNGKHFNTGLAIREAVEIALQTYQAHQLSRSVARPSINTVAVAAIVANCLSSPIVFYVFRKRETAGRFLSLLIDMALDLCSANVIPLAVLLPYLQAYDSATTTFPPSLYQDDAWFLAALQEIRQLCVTSSWDYLATLLPHVSVLSVLHVATVLIQKSCSTKRRMAVSVQTRDEKSFTSVTSSQRHVRVDPYPTTRFHRSIHLILAVGWSVGVLTIHNLSQHHGTVSTNTLGCRLPLAAWFATQPSCAIVQINCNRHGAEGSAAYITTRLEPFYRPILQHVIITHCARLEIPPTIQSLDRLARITLYNVTLTNWPRDAAITSHSHPRFTNIELEYVRFDCVPEGIFHNDMPDRFVYFMVARSNLSTLPDNLGALWQKHRFKTISLQHTQLKMLPSTFFLLRARVLRLISNGIEALDDSAFDSPDDSLWTTLHLSGNPLRALPSSITTRQRLTKLIVEDTSVSTISQGVANWLRAMPSAVVSFAGSPVCNASLSSDRVCTVHYGDAEGTIVWDVLAAQRPLDRY